MFFAFLICIPLLRPAAKPIHASQITLTVTVVNAAQIPLPQIQVVLWQRVAGVWQFTNVYGDTDIDGSKVFNISATGEYTLEFTDNTAKIYMREFYADAASLEGAQSIFSTGANIEVTATLDRASTLSGQVLRAGDPLAPISGATIEIFRETPEGWDVITPVTSDETGAYLVPGLVSGVYRVKASASGYFSSHFSNDSSGEPSLIPIADGAEVTDIDIVLEQEAVITGKLQKSPGVGMNGISVCVISEEAVENSSGFDSSNCAQRTATNNEGDFRLTELHAGRYFLYFYDESMPPRARDGWYDNSTTLTMTYTQASLVDVESGDVHTMTTVTVEPVMSFYGMTKDMDGAPLANAEVRIYRQDGALWRWQESVRTNGEGYFAAEIVQAGIFAAGVLDGAHAPRYHAGTTTLGDATITQIPTDTVAAYMVEMVQAGGTIQGRIVGENGLPLADIEVHGFLGQRGTGPDDNLRPPEWLRMTTTSDAGEFVLHGLGDEPVWLVARDATGALADHWYPGVTEFAHAARVTATLASTITLDEIVISSAAGTPQTSAWQEGTVVALENGAPIAGAEIRLYWLPGWRARVNVRDWEPNTCPSSASTGESIPFGQAASGNTGIRAFSGIGAVTPEMNSLRSDSLGRFGWRLTPGCWYVEVRTADGTSMRSPIWGVTGNGDTQPQWRIEVDVPVPTPTSTPSPSVKPSSTPSQTPSRTPSVTPTTSPTASSTPTPTATATPSLTATGTASPTFTPTGTPLPPSTIATEVPSPVSTTQTPVSSTGTPATSTPAMSTPGTSTPQTGTPELTSTPEFTATPSRTPTMMPTLMPTLMPTEERTPQLYFLYGVLYADENGNGVKEDSEAGIGGTTIELDEEEEDEGAFSESAPMLWRQSTVTSVEGAFAFYNVPEGIYTLTIIPPQGIFLHSPSVQRVSIDKAIAAMPFDLAVQLDGVIVFLPLIGR